MLKRRFRFHYLKNFRKRRNNFKKLLNWYKLPQRVQIYLKKRGIDRVVFLKQKKFKENKRVRWLRRRINIFHWRPFRVPSDLFYFLFIRRRNLIKKKFFKSLKKLRGVSKLCLILEKKKVFPPYKKVLTKIKKDQVLFPLSFSSSKKILIKAKRKKALFPLHFSFFKFNSLNFLKRLNNLRKRKIWRGRKAKRHWRVLNRIKFNKKLPLLFNRLIVLPWARLPFFYLYDLVIFWFRFFYKKIQSFFHSFFLEFWCNVYFSFLVLKKNLNKENSFFFNNFLIFSKTGLFSRISFFFFSVNQRKKKESILSYFFFSSFKRSFKIFCKFWLLPEGKHRALNIQSWFWRKKYLRGKIKFQLKRFKRFKRWKKRWKKKRNLFFFPSKLKRFKFKRQHGVLGDLTIINYFLRVQQRFFKRIKRIKKAKSINFKSKRNNKLVINRKNLSNFKVNFLIPFLPSLSLRYFIRGIQVIKWQSFSKDFLIKKRLKSIINIHLKKLYLLIKTKKAKQIHFKRFFFLKKLKILLPALVFPNYLTLRAFFYYLVANHWIKIKRQKWNNSIFWENVKKNFLKKKKNRLIKLKVKNFLKVNGKDNITINDSDLHSKKGKFKFFKTLKFFKLKQEINNNIINSLDTPSISSISPVPILSDSNSKKRKLVQIIKNNLKLKNHARSKIFLNLNNNIDKIKSKQKVMVDLVEKLIKQKTKTKFLLGSNRFYSSLIKKRIKRKNLCKSSLFFIYNQLIKKKLFFKNINLWKSRSFFFKKKRKLALLHRRKLLLCVKFNKLLRKKKRSPSFLFLLPKKSYKL